MKYHLVATLILLSIIGLIIYILTTPRIMGIVLIVILVHYIIKSYKMILKTVKNFMN
jgi:hypothetical protein